MIFGVSVACVAGNHKVRMDAGVYQEETFSGTVGLSRGLRTANVARVASSSGLPRTHPEPLLPQTAHTLVATGRPFFRMTCSRSMVSVRALHFKQ